MVADEPAPLVEGAARQPAARRSKPSDFLGLAATATAWLALIAFAIGSVGSALWGQTTFLATQVFEGFAPWAATDPSPLEAPVTNQWLGDTLDAVAPGMLLHQHSLSTGEFAGWDPYVAGGAASASIPDDATFSPLSLPWYVLPYTYAPGAVKLLEIAAVTLGMSLLLRRFHLPSATWALGSLVYSSSAFMVAWTNWPQTRVAAMIPLLFWSVDAAVCRRRWRDLVPLALVTATMLAGGFPAVTGMAAYAVGAYAVARVLVSTRQARELLRAAGVLACGVLGGIGLVAWQLLPFVHLLTNVVDFSSRQQTPQSHIESEALATALVPEIYGGPVQSYWGIQHNPIETFSYIGAAAFVLILVALVVPQSTRERRFLRAFALIALATSVVLIYVGGFPLGVFQHLPVFSNNSIGRATSLMGFLAALAASIGLGSLAETGQPRLVFARARPRPGRAATDARSATDAPSWFWDWRTALRVVTTAALAAAAGRLVLSAWPEVPPEHWAAIKEAIIRGGLYCIIGGVLALTVVLTRHVVARLAAAFLLPALVLIPALAVTAVWWPKGPTEYFYPVTPTHEFLADNLGHDRYITVDWTMFPGTSSAYGLRAANGHTFHTVEWRDLLLAADPEVMTTPTYSTLKSTDLATVLASPVLDRLAVRYVVMDPWAIPPGSVEQLRTSEETTYLEPGRIGTALVTTPFRGVILTLPEGMPVGPGGAEVHVRAVTDGGTEVAATTQAVAVPYPAAQMWIPLAGEATAGETLRIEVSVSGVSSPVALAGDSGDDLAISVLRPLDDNLRVVHTTGAIVIERLSALDRIRWADTEVVANSDEEEVELLASGVLGEATVLLENAGDAISPRSSTAEVSVLTDGLDEVAVRVNSTGDGWIVIADSVRSGGWHAHVDGEEVALVEAEHALGAIAVPGGSHLVELRYEAPGMRIGLAITTATAVALMVVLFVSSRSARRARAHARRSHPMVGLRPWSRP